MKNFKKLLAVTLACLMAFSSLSVLAFAGQAQEVQYEITNPYKDVDFDAYKAYKAQLHCHTNASDGYLPIKSAIEKYYDLDYDIVAITDHGTINQGWDTEPELIPLVRAIKKERTQGLPVYPLSQDEYQSYVKGTAKTTNGLVRTHNEGMLDVEKGIELNMATPFADCHLTGYWSDYGQGLAGVFGDYETPSAGVKEAGGISMLSHVGEYVYIDKDSVDHVGQLIDEYYPNKFAKIFLDNAGSSVGMGINSATDCHTRCDRILYDQILQRTIPNGVTPWGFTFSDSHTVTSMDDAYTIMMMPELTNKALRSCMEKGEFFAVSHYSYALELDGEPEWPKSYATHDHDVDCMLYDEETDTVKLNLSATPVFTNIEVDDETDTISVEFENADRIVWVSNGNVLRRDENITDGKASICLKDVFKDKDGNEVEPYLYIRFYITGEDGICYAQPMVIKKNGEAFRAVEVPETHDISTFLRGLVTVFDWVFFKWNPIIWAFKYFALGYDPIIRFINDLMFWK